MARTNQQKLDRAEEAADRTMGMLQQRYEDNDPNKPARVLDNLDGGYMLSVLSGQIAGLYTAIGQVVGGDGTVDLDAIRKASEEGAAAGASKALADLRIVSGEGK